MSRSSKWVETGCRLHRAGGDERFGGMTATKCGVSFWGNKNVQTLIVVMDPTLGIF